LVLSGISGDLKSPFQVSWLQLRAAGFLAWLVSFFSVFRTRNSKLETAIETAQGQASLRKRILFVAHHAGLQSLAHD
jgi:hypothetical protein